MNRGFIGFLLLAAVAGLIGYMSNNRSHIDSYSQHELDIRLTYKRYKELYPHSTISYPEYKELQKRQAFRRSISSRKLKRMVR